MRKLWILSLLVAVTMFGPAVCVGAAESPAIGFEALTAFDQLPLLVDWPAYQDSSYSREHQNADSGNFIRVEEDGEKVMVDTDGPGVIYRIWSTGITGLHLSPKTRVWFYFDGEEKPSLDLAASELFGDRGAKWPFVQPLARTFESGRGDLEGPASICYVPIPFAKHIKITTNNLAFYHVNYIKYPPGTAVESFTMALVEKNRATLEKAAEMFLARGQIPSPPEGAMELTEGPVDVPAGKTAALYEGKGPGVVRALRVKLHRAMNVNLHGLVLQIQYDGSSANSVNVPIGDFFGASGSDLRYRSLPMGTTDAGYYCYFPMPFRRSIRILVRNDTSEDARVFRSVSVKKASAIPANSGYFHAAYHRDEKPAMGVDYNILTTSGGRGKFVGCNIFMQGAIGTESISFLEGDEAIYVDDEKEWPSRWVGTGTEDYFNGSFYWNGIQKEEMDQPYGGITQRHDGMRRVCAYRWHITDFISFKERIKVDMQHGPVSNFPSDYASVGYWYMEKPIASPKLPSLDKRIPRSELPAPIMMGCRFEGEFTSDGKPVQVRHMRTVDKEYWTDVLPEELSPKRMQIFCPAKEIGQEITGKLYVPGEDHYRMKLFLTVGPSYGKVGVFLNKRWLGNVNAYNETFLPARQFDLPMRPLKEGAHELTFRMLGRDVMATGMDFGLAGMHCSPVGAKSIREWQIIGPWPCPKDGGWEVVNPPEKEIDFDKTYEVTIPRHGKATKITAKWRAISLPPTAGVASHAYFSWDPWQVSYGVTYIWSPRDQVVGAFIGKDDGIAIWINDEKVLDDNTWSHYRADHLIATCALKKGWNKMLVKNSNWLGAWAWHIRLTDAKGELKISNTPPQ